MTKHARRDFIKQMGAFAALAIAGRDAFSAAFSDDAEPFDFLVIGDSLIWGQGLREEQKFYQLTKEWLERDVFKSSRAVNMKVKAHSGASINLRQYEADALRAAEIGEDEFFHREINLSFPSIHTQIEAARKEYENPQTVDLIMLTGGITDIRLSVILNPLKSNDELKSDIIKHCNEKMFELLLRAAETFPNAHIALVGYYPFISKHTPASQIFDSVMELQNFPEALEFLINNPLNRRLLKRYRKKMVERSKIWAENSTVEYKKAIDRLNAKFDKPRAVFIESPITEETCIGTKNSLLFEIKNGKTNDALAAERKSVCRETLDKLRKATNLKLKNRTCELAPVGHPNAEGSKAIAGAIEQKLASILQNKS